MTAIPKYASAPTDDLSFCDLIANCEIRALIIRVGSAIANFFLSIMTLIFPCCTSSKKPTNAEYLFLARRDENSQYGCCGSFSVEKADIIWQKLQKDPAPGISFDRAIVHNAKSIIGTCTAMSLEFASTYFRLREEGVSEALLDKLRSLEEGFKESSEEMRSRQIAFSSITVDPTAAIDISKSKIESCVKCHDFSIDYCSDEIDITSGIDILRQEIERLPQGVYFVRMLKPKINHKMEERGHSMIYVHEKDLTFFYDNNQGLENITPVSAVGTLLERLSGLHQEWDIPNVRFYRLQPFSLLPHVYSGPW